MNKLTNEINEYVKEFKILRTNQGLKMRTEEAYRLNQPYEEFFKRYFYRGLWYKKRKWQGNRIINVRFLYKKYLDEFQVNYLCGDTRKKFKELKTLKFIEIGYISFNKEGSELLFTFLS